MPLKVFTVLYVSTAIKFCQNVKNHESDSENVRRLWHGSPQPSGGVNKKTLFLEFYPGPHDVRNTFVSCSVVVAEVSRLWNCCLVRNICWNLVDLDVSCVVNGGKCSIWSHEWKISADKWSIRSFQWTTETDGERSVWFLFWVRSTMSLNSHEFHFCRGWCCAGSTAHGFAWLKSPLPHPLPPLLPLTTTPHHAHFGIPLRTPLQTLS